MKAAKGVSMRNQSMECCKMLAAILIVFVHIPFPGIVGELFNCLVRFSVPMFFAISGYFSFGVRREKLSKRILHIIRLNVAAIAACIIWNCIAAVCLGESIFSQLRKILPGVKGVASWLFLHINPFGGHLWYLTAILVCYAALWAYVSFYGDDKPDYRPLYAVSTALLAIRFVMSDLMQFIGYSIPYFFCRDGWFFGLPMFSMGLFIREHYDRICTNYRLTTSKLLGVFLLGVLLSLLQWRSYGTSELPMGALVQAFALMLLMIGHPTIDFGNKAAAEVISILGYLSAAVYILHMLVNEAYMLFAEEKLTSFMGNAEHWLQPLIVLLATITVSLIIKGCTTLLDLLRRE